MFAIVPFFAYLRKLLAHYALASMVLWIYINKGFLPAVRDDVYRMQVVIPNECEESL